MSSAFDFNTLIGGKSFQELCSMSFNQFKIFVKNLSYEELHNLFILIKETYIRQSEDLKRCGVRGKVSRRKLRQEARRIYNQYRFVDEQLFEELVLNYILENYIKLTTKLPHKEYYRIIGRLKKYAIMAEIVYFEARWKVKKQAEAHDPNRIDLFEGELKPIDVAKLVDADSNFW